MILGGDKLVVFLYPCKRVVSSQAAAQRFVQCKVWGCYWSDRFYAEYHRAQWSYSLFTEKCLQSFLLHVWVHWDFCCFHSKVVAHVDVLQQRCNRLWYLILILFVFLVLLVVLFLGLKLKVYFSLSLANIKACVCVRERERVRAAWLNHPFIFLLIW